MDPQHWFRVLIFFEETLWRGEGLYLLVLSGTEILLRKYAHSTLFSGSLDKRFCFYRRRISAWQWRRLTRWLPVASSLCQPKVSLSASSRSRIFATTVPYSSATPPTCPPAASGNRSGPSFVCELDLYVRYRICKLAINISNQKLFSESVTNNSLASSNKFWTKLTSTVLLSCWWLDSISCLPRPFVYHSLGFEARV